MNKRIEELNELRKEVIELNCLQNGHLYGPWSKENDEYTRTCTKCMFERKIKSTTPIPEIEDEIRKQEKGKELLTYLYAAKKETLAPENIIFYLWTTKSYLSYIDSTKLQTKIQELNTPSIDSLNEYQLINKITNSIQKIHSNIRNASDEEWEEYDTLWQEVDNYVESMMPQTKSSSL